MKTYKIGDRVALPNTAQDPYFADLFENPETATKNIAGKITTIFEGTTRVESSNSPDAIAIINNDLQLKIKLSDIPD